MSIELHCALLCCLLTVFCCATSECSTCTAPILTSCSLPVRGNDGGKGGPLFAQYSTIEQVGFQSLSRIKISALPKHSIDTEPTTAVDEASTVATATGAETATATATAMATTTSCEGRLHCCIASMLIHRVRRAWLINRSRFDYP